MEGNNKQTQSSIENENVQDDIMNRVNQTFAKINQDVKSMINDNNQHNNLQ
jgi:hypothetical protein